MEVCVVASDVAGLPEVVRAPWGRLVAPGDADALAAALGDAPATPLAERARAGAAGRALVVDELGLDAADQRDLRELIDSAARSSGPAAIVQVQPVSAMSSPSPVSSSAPASVRALPSARSSRRSSRLRRPKLATARRAGSRRAGRRVARPRRRCARRFCDARARSRRRACRPCRGGRGCSAAVATAAGHGAIARRAALAGTLGPATANEPRSSPRDLSGMPEMSARFAKADAAFDTAWDEPPAEPGPLVENEWSVALITAEPRPPPSPKPWVPPATDVAPAAEPAATAAPATWNVLDEGSPDAAKAAAGASWTVPALATVADPPAEKKDAAPDTWQTGRAAPVALGACRPARGARLQAAARPHRAAQDRRGGTGRTAARRAGRVRRVRQGRSGQNGLPLAISPAGKSPDETAAAVRRAARQARARRTAARQRAARRRAAAATRRRRAAARRRAAQATAARGTGPVRTSAPVTAVAPPAQRSSGPARAQPQQSAPKLQEASPPASTSAPSFQPTTSNPAGAQSVG